MVSIDCKNCGKERLCYPGRLRKFCSRSCDQEYKSVKAKVCSYCRESFTKYGKQNFCSRVCFFKNRTLPEQYPTINTYTPSGATRELPISNSDKTTTVDAEVFEALDKFKWHLSDTGYVMRRVTIDGRLSTIRLHKLILPSDQPFVTDHIDRNKLNNTMGNLRKITQALNRMNSDRADKAKHYYYSKKRDKWVVESQSLGVKAKQFDNEKDAKAYINNKRRNHEIKYSLSYEDIHTKAETKKRVYSPRNTRVDSDSVSSPISKLSSAFHKLVK